MSNMHPIIAILKWQEYKKINRAQIGCNHIISAVEPARDLLHLVSI